MSNLLPSDYPEFLRNLKAKIQARQTRAILAVNRELIALYWEIGQQIVERQETAGWGDAVITQLERDLKREMPDLEAFLGVTSTGCDRSILPTVSKVKLCHSLWHKFPGGTTLCYWRK
jgi:predicted nuclease of restriction endonuclease-like (RecB) superfamily